MSGGSGGDSFMDTLSDVFSPISDLASGAVGTATSYLGNRGAARNAAANSMARQGQFTSMGMTESPASRGASGLDGDVSSVTL